MFRGFNSRIARPSADKFVDIAKLKTQQHRLPSINKAKYAKRSGLEGPFMTKAGQVVYYDKIKGQYYNPDNDMYLSYDDWKKLSEVKSIGLGPYQSGKAIATKMMKYPSMKAFAPKVAKIKIVTRADLEKILPDYVGGKVITTILGEEVSNRKYTVVHADKGKVVVDAKSSYEAAIKAAAKWGLKSTSGVDAHLMEEAPANATGTSVAGTGDDSSTVVVKKKKPLQDKLMKRMGIKEAIDRAVPDLEYPKDEITERKQQLIDMAKNA